MKPFYVLLFALTPPQCFAQHVKFSYDNNGNRIHREWVAERIGEDNSPKSLQLQFSSEPSDENAFNVVVDNRRSCLDVLENGGPVSESHEAWLVDTQGRSVYRWTVTASQSHLKLPSLIEGTYVFTLKCTHKSYSWKILKK